MKQKLLIRFDDICPTMNWELWYKAESLLDNYNIKPLIGVIPECKDSDLNICAENKDFWLYVKKLQDKGYTIALHGLNHVFTTNKRGIINNRFISEFAGHTYKEQYEKIRLGKEILESKGISTNIFFAPAHSYDNNTIRALADNGFKYMSDGFSKYPYEKFGVKCLPTRASSKNPLCTLVFHAHEWSYKPNDFITFLDCINNRIDKIVTFNEFAQSETHNLIVELFREKLYVFRKRYLSKLYVFWKSLSACH
jgi:predicted deacetylase